MRVEMENGDLFIHRLPQRFIYKDYDRQLGGAPYTLSATAPSEPHIGFHNAPLAALIAPQPTCAGSRGILHDRGFRGGISTHRGLQGFFYSKDERFDTFTDGDGWVQFEIWTNRGTTLKGGYPNRYCKRRAPGEFAKDIFVRFLWIRVDDVPTTIQAAVQRAEDA